MLLSGASIDDLVLYWQKCIKTENKLGLRIRSFIIKKNNIDFFNILFEIKAIVGLYFFCFEFRCERKSEEKYKYKLACFSRGNVCFKTAD